MRKLLKGLLLLVLACPSLAARAIGADPLDKIDPQVVTETENGAEASYWVILNLQADLAAAYAIPDWNERGRYVYEELRFVAGSTQGNCVDVLEANRADRVACYWVTNCMFATSGRDALLAVAALDEVRRVIADVPFSIDPPIVTLDEPRIGSVEWGIAAVAAPRAWATYQALGQGVVVGLIDTGAQFDHPALAPSYRGNLGGGLWNHHRSWFDPAHICPGGIPCDNNGHGTHTTGTVAGGDGPGPFSNDVGVAPGARWIMCKGCEQSSCTSSSLVACGQWMLAPTDLSGLNPDPTKRPHICSNSWGGGRGGVFYRDVLVSMRASGILPVFANGNAGPACGTAADPGEFPEAFAVGAIDSGDGIASFSARGPSYYGPVKPEVSAPGVAVRSSIPGGLYQSLSGTSMATPHVSGVAALLLSAVPSLVGKLDDIETILQAAARPKIDLTCGGDSISNDVFGAGVVSAAEAIRLALPPPPGKPFVRGRECAPDGRFDIADPITLLSFLFTGGAGPSCRDACDETDDGRLDVSDPVAMLAYLFQGTAAPAMPFPDCGVDPTGDPLGCESSSCP